MKESLERHRQTHERLMKVIGDPFCNADCVPEFMREYTARHAARALEAVAERRAAIRILESDNEELKLAIAERRLNGMRVDSPKVNRDSPKDALSKCLLDPEWKMADDDHSKCL